MKTFSLGTFLLKYKNDDACLEHIKNIRFPQGIGCANCRTITKFTKVKGRPVYQCSCGYQVSPLANTIFEKTTTPLQYWFYAMFIMTATRSGISAKQLQRELGVTYKTAWRMMKQIRLLMANIDYIPMRGIVEIDESYFGGKPSNRKFKVAGKGKEAVMGMVEREGKAYIKHIPNTYGYTLLGVIKKKIDPRARIMSDELPTYNHLRKMGYVHSKINHSKRYVLADIHTQNIESMWSNIKRGVYGVYRHVSREYLQTYLDEYSWRFNHRQNPSGMFDLLLSEIAEVTAIKSKLI